MSNTHLDRATILTEALPYIQRYNGKIVVVNCGGVAMNQELRDAVATDITLLRLVGVKVVLVHGIGPEVRLPVVDGFPQVNESAIDLVQETLCGKVNKTLVATLNKLGAKAIGLCGIDGGFLTAKSAGGDHPCTGELVQVDGGLLEDFLSKGYTPVVATIAQGAGVQRQRQPHRRQAGGGSEGGEAHPPGGGRAAAPHPRVPGRAHPGAPPVPGARPHPQRDHPGGHGRQGELQRGGGALRRQIRHPAGRERPPRHSAGAAVRRGHRHHADPLRRGDRR